MVHDGEARLAHQLLVDLDRRARVVADDRRICRHTELSAQEAAELALSEMPSAERERLQRAPNADAADSSAATAATGSTERIMRHELRQRWLRAPTERRLQAAERLPRTRADMPTCEQKSRIGTRGPKMR